MRAGLAQIKVQKRVQDVGAVMAGMMARDLSCEAIAAELRRLGHSAPRGGPWGPASLRRYMKRAATMPNAPLPIETIP